jgi:AraC-like DNA-binding protein
MDPILTTIQTQVLIAKRDVLDTSWYQPGRQDPFNRLYYIESGSGYVTHNNQTYNLKPGRLYVIPANVWHVNGTDNKINIRWTHFTAMLQGGMDLFAYLRCPYELILSNRRHIEGLFSELVELWSSFSPGNDFKIISLQLQLLIPFLEANDVHEQEKHQLEIKRFQPVLDAINNQLANPPSVPELARLIHLEPSYFTRLFTRHFGMPPVRYILQQRIRQAQLFLRQTDRTIDDVGEALGFVDGFHLSKVFKKFTGLSPGKYRLLLHHGRP